MFANFALLGLALVLALIGIYFGVSAFRDYRAKTRSFKRR